MRSGLVVIGVALAVVGVGLTLSAFFEPGAPAHSQVNPLAAPNLMPGEPRTMVVWLQNTSSGTLQLSWVSSSPVNVSIYRATDCDFVTSSSPVPYCPEGPALATWPANSSGHWNTSGTISFPLLLNLQAVGSHAANVNGVFDEVWAATGSSLPTWIFVSTLAGGVICISMGAIAIFLGLFLRSGVYDRPAEPIEPPFDPDDDFPDDPEPDDDPDVEPPVQ